MQMKGEIVWKYVANSQCQMKKNWLKAHIFPSKTEQNIPSKVIIASFELMQTHKAKD